MVMTPWSDNEMPLARAAEIGTRKVITCLLYTSRDMHEPLLTEIRTSGVLSAESEEALKKAIVDFKVRFLQQA